MYIVKNRAGYTWVFFKQFLLKVLSGRGLKKQNGDQNQTLTGLQFCTWRRAMVTGRVEASRRGVVLLVIYVLLLPSLLRRGALRGKLLQFLLATYPH